MDLKLENTISSGSWNVRKGPCIEVDVQVEPSKLNDQDNARNYCQMQVARCHMQVARTRVQAWTETKNLKSNTQSNHIQVISQKQTEGLAH